MLRETTTPERPKFIHSTSYFVPYTSKLNNWTPKYPVRGPNTTLWRIEHPRMTGLRSSVQLVKSFETEIRLAPAHLWYLEHHRVFGYSELGDPKTTLYVGLTRFLAANSAPHPNRPPLSATTDVTYYLLGGSSYETHESGVFSFKNFCGVRQIKFSSISDFFSEISEISEISKHQIQFLWTKTHRNWAFQEQL